MSFFDPKTSRYLKHHLSRMSFGQTQREVQQEDLEIPPDHVAHKPVQPNEILPVVKSRRPSVAPIRSLSTRQIPRYSSSTELRRAETQQAQSDRELRRTASGNIVRNLQILEDLLGELDRVAIQAEESTTQPVDPNIYRDAATSLSPGVQLHAAAQSLEPPVHPPEQQKAAYAFPQWHAIFSSKNVSSLQVPQHVHPVDHIRACEAVHLKKNITKAAPAPAELTGPDENFEMKLLRRESQDDLVVDRPSTLQQGPQALQPSPEGDKQVTSGLASEGKTSLSMKRHRYRVKANQPPPVSPRSSPTRGSNSEEDHANPISTSLPLDLNDHDPVLLTVEEHHSRQVSALNSQHKSVNLAHQSAGTSAVVDSGEQRYVEASGTAEDDDLHYQRCNHTPLVRDWPNTRKRFAALVACLNAACIGIVIGIYSGEVPAIQYMIADFHHYTILGNVFLYSGMALSTFLFWPLPLLHGRKLYTVAGLTVAMCLQIPQAIAVSDYRSPYVASYRELLFLPRAFSGFGLGFVIINVQGTLLDCFGTSLQVHQPHEEVLDPQNVRRHGGGMGAWLGVWWVASLASISLGFMTGAFIINTASVIWGFWTSFVLLLAMSLLNIIAPDVRRSGCRRSITGTHDQDTDLSRGVKGEVKMHGDSMSPSRWDKEILGGIKVSWLMVKQPGFVILATYTAWVYAQFTMILMLLGALASRYYLFKPVHVGLCILALTLGSTLAVPFEKASWLSRARHHPPRTDSMTVQVGITWSSHSLRRMVFTGLLPLAALASTLTSKGPPLSVAIPCLFAALVGFLSTLAVAECFALIMETFDISDLQPGKTGQAAHRLVAARDAEQRTESSCYPRVNAGSALTQSMMFIFAAVATGLCSRLERKLGAMVATACIAAALLFLTLLLTIVLARVKSVKMIRDHTPGMNRNDENGRQPVTSASPSGTRRRISILEAGRQTRWSEIRRRNGVYQDGLTGS